MGHESVDYRDQLSGNLDLQLLSTANHQQHLLLMEVLVCLAIDLVVTELSRHIHSITDYDLEKPFGSLHVLCLDHLLTPRSLSIRVRLALCALFLRRRLRSLLLNLLRAMSCLTASPSVGCGVLAPHER